MSGICEALSSHTASLWIQLAAVLYAAYVVDAPLTYQGLDWCLGLRPSLFISEIFLGSLATPPEKLVKFEKQL